MSRADRRRFNAGRDRCTSFDPFILGERRRRATWFKAPAPAQMFAAQLVRPRYYRPDFAKQPMTNAEYADLQLKRPRHTGDQKTLTFAGKQYHLTQTYDGVLRLAPGASPW